MSLRIEKEEMDRYEGRQGAYADMELIKTYVSKYTQFKVTNITIAFSAKTAELKLKLKEGNV